MTVFYVCMNDSNHAFKSRLAIDAVQCPYCSGPVKDYPDLENYRDIKRRIEKSRWKCESCGSTEYEDTHLVAEGTLVSSYRECQKCTAHFKVPEKDAEEYAELSKLTVLR